MNQAKLDLHIVLDALHAVAKGEALETDTIQNIRDIAKSSGHNTDAEDIKNLHSRTT